MKSRTSRGLRHGAAAMAREMVDCVAAPAPAQVVQAAQVAAVGAPEIVRPHPGHVAAWHGVAWPGSAPAAGMAATY